MNTELWVDLEGTIIPHWDYINDFINQDKFEHLVNGYNPSRIVIYSYAVWSDIEREEFKNSDIYTTLLSHAPVVIKTVSDITNDCRSLHAHMSHIPERNALYVPKEFSFLMSVRREIERGSQTDMFILFDDSVQHNNSYTINDNQIVLYMNPDDMVL